jgi:glyoxylase-like metal-dependent hydrolase (beta-lactamase superfamily II)
MENNKEDLEVKRFESDKGKNQYLLISGKQAAVIDVSDAVDDVGKIVTEMGLTLKYLLVSHAHQSHVEALPMLKQNFNGTWETLP